MLPYALRRTFVQPDPAGPQPTGGTRDPGTSLPKHARAAGLAAWMIAECGPAPASWVLMIDMPVSLCRSNTRLRG